MMSSSRTALAAILRLLFAALLVQQQQACPFQFLKGAGSEATTVDDPSPNSGVHRHLLGEEGLFGFKTSIPGSCKEPFKGDDCVDRFPFFSPRFYENKGCPKIWKAIVEALDKFPNIEDCLAALIRNSFHMAVGTGHNGILLLEDYGSRAQPRDKPNNIAFNSGPNPFDFSGTSNSSKYAFPNLTTRCYDVYEYLREEIDKWTKTYCHGLYVTCTDLANYAAKYAHWKLSDEEFLPCFQFGYADLEVEDFSKKDPILGNRQPREASNNCLPPPDNSGATRAPPPFNISLEDALSKDRYKEFFQNQVINKFSHSCLENKFPLADVDVVPLSAGHTIGQAHCFAIQQTVKTPFQNTVLFKKLAADCQRCNNVTRDGGSLPPYGSFKENLFKKDFSFAQRCITTGEQDTLPVGLTTDINRAKAFGGFSDPCCVPLDLFTKDSFDFAYFAQVELGFGLFESDNSLARFPTTATATFEWARCQRRKKLAREYVEAWNKMTNIGAKPYSYSKPRRFCSAPSWAKPRSK